MAEFLKEILIPLENKKSGIPDESSVQLLSPPEMKKMGRTSELVLRFKSADEGELEKSKKEARKERDDTGRLRRRETGTVRCSQM